MTKVFINYAREDIETARKLYQELKSISGIQPWLDQEDLLPGVRWVPEIRKAIRESDFFLALLSKASVAKREYVQKERKDALDILDEFPEDQSFIIPIRLEDCPLPFERMREIQYVDFFPDRRNGLEKVLKVISSTPRANTPTQKEALTGYEFRCAIIDFDNGMTNLPQICQRLNAIQNFFHFTHPSISLRKKAVRKFDGLPNLFINDLPDSLYEQKTEYPNVGFVICLTKHLLAFEDEEGLFQNYLSIPGLVDGTFLFISTNQLYYVSKESGCTFEKGFVYNILSQLIVYFAANLGFHKEVRGCILDFCLDRSVMIKGLKAMRLCSKCFAKLRSIKLKDAMGAILADQIRV